MKFTKENIVYFCLCLFLGFTGAHKFYKGKILLGFVYLFTGGLFLIGWAVDLIHLKDQAHSADVPPLKVSNTKREAREPVGELSHLDFGKPAGELGCYLNYCKYNVLCTNEQGKRISRQRTGLDVQKAIDKVAAEGFLPPYKAKPLEYFPPSEKQFDYLKDLGVFIPDGITNVDASCMISRATGEDSEEGPTAEIVALAFALGVEFSAFEGASGLFSSIIGQADDRQKAALFAYGVKQNAKGHNFGNMVEDPDVDLFYLFSDLVIADEALLRSLKGRDARDYEHPHRGTAIYKAAEDFLKSKGVI